VTVCVPLIFKAILRTQRPEGVLDVFCIIGAQAPETHDEPGEEGIRLLVRGGINFNKIPAEHGNMNVYIQTA
ncbi:MAG: hypothetical protein ACRDGU_11315, partial [Actinomycetota bacterium]